jgi:hypothetical protein
MCDTSLSQTILKLKSRLSTFSMNFFNSLMRRVATGFCSRQYGGYTPNNSANRPECLMCVTKAMPIILQRFMAIMFSATRMANSNSINNNNGDLFFCCMSQILFSTLINNLKYDSEAHRYRKTLYIYYSSAVIRAGCISTCTGFLSAWPLCTYLLHLTLTNTCGVARTSVHLSIGMSRGYQETVN